MKVLKKIAVLIALLVVTAIVADRLWYDHEAYLAGFKEARVDPISGSRLISEDFIDQNMMAGTTIWVYQLPDDYEQQLYKDCSHIGYKQGSYHQDVGTTPEPALDKYIKLDGQGCYMVFVKTNDFVIAQFMDNKLVIFNIWG